MQPKPIEAGDAPELTAILLCCLLFKLGGQVTLTLDEIHEIHTNFPAIRFVLAGPTNELHLADAISMRLRSVEAVEADIQQRGN